MEEYIFISPTIFKEGDSGKIILYRKGVEILLLGNMIQNLEEANKLLEHGEGWFFECPHGKYGFHKGILKEIESLLIEKGILNEGESLNEEGILGGSFAVCINGKFYIAGWSTEFGPIHLEAVKKCLEGQELEVIAKSDKNFRKGEFLGGIS